MVQLGDKVRDLVTGFEGIAVASTTWLNGCERVSVQPVGKNEKGGTFESETFDVTQLEVVEAGVVATGQRETGGPRPDPVGWPDGARG
ncbi:MAG: hypothetical protein ABI780_01775 [Ardenticatenales bacterium]